MNNLAVEFRGVCKHFGEVKANQDVSFSVEAGTIHGLIGENGAGKSTAMKMLFGMDKPDLGEIFLFGQKVQFSSAAAAMNAGIGMVHQHFMLSESETALENFLLTQKSSKPFHVYKFSQELQKAQKISEELGFTIPWEKKVQDLSVGEQQRLEIIKALSQKGKVLILDEPTAVLTPQETQDLFERLRLLKVKGHTILLITHKLKEVLALTDEITVFRAGRVVAQLKTSETTLNSLAESMIGRKVGFHKRDVKLQTQKISTKLLLENMKAHSRSEKISPLQLDISELKVNGGEIVGVAGVEGNGQKELTELLLHPQIFERTGKLEMMNTSNAQASTHQIRNQALAVFPEDRLRLGAIADMDLCENFLLGYQSRWGRFLLPWKKIRQETETNIHKFQVAAPHSRALFSQLSGGNQQKLVVARELSQNPEFILASQPTRGVDIGAIEFIHEQLIQFQEKGAGVLLISSDLDELMKLSDRLYVLYQGRVMAHFTRSQFDEQKIGLAMGGKTP